MHIENGRDLTRGILILVFAAISYWINLNIGRWLMVIMGLLILQSAFTDWCPADLFLRSLGLKGKLQTIEKRSNG